MNNLFSESNQSGLYFYLTPRANSLNLSGSSFLGGGKSVVVTSLPSKLCYLLSILFFDIIIYF